MVTLDFSWGNSFYEIWINRKSGIRDNSSHGAFCLYFYLFVIFLGALGCVFAAKEERISTDLIFDLRFMIKANPLVAWCMVLFMLSMAGIPPAIGFYTKFVILESMVVADLLWLAVFAVLFSVVGAFYYLRIVKIILFDGMY